MLSAWTIRSRRFARDLAFWLAIVGYDRKDHSLTHRIYLLYAFLFFAGWGLAVLSLAAGTTATLLQQMPFQTPADAGMWVSALVAIVWGILTLFRASESSPFVFREEDAFLICQTPANRRGVALIWFLGGWIESVLPFWAGSFVLGFARIEWLQKSKVAITDLPLYLSSGFQAWLVLALVQLGLMALIWAVGATRLWADRELPQIRWLAPALAALFILLGYNAPRAIWPPAQHFWQDVVVGGLFYPLWAAFTPDVWMWGAVIALIGVAAGLAALLLASGKLNLSRAAQETVWKERMRSAWFSGQSDAAADLAAERRLTGDRRPGRLLRLEGELAFLAKDWLQVRRGLALGDFWHWWVMAGICLGLGLAPDWAPLGFAFILWTVQAGQRLTRRLRADLGRWWMLRMQPVRAERLLWSEMGSAWVALTVFSLLSMLAGGKAAQEFGWALLVVIPAAGASVAMMMAIDIFRQAKAGSLLLGNVPEISALGTLLGLLAAGGPVLLLGSSPLLALALSLTAPFIGWKIAADLLRRIE